MAPIRIKTTHAKRLFAGAFASCAAAVAMAYSFSGGHHYGDGSDSHRHGAADLLGGGYGDVGIGANGSSGASGGLADSGGSPGGDAQTGTGGQSGPPHHDGSYGPGDGHDDHSSGLRPNGENGLVILTDFVNGLDDKDGNGQGAGGGAFSTSDGHPGGDQGGPQGAPGGSGPGGFGGFGGGGGGSTPPGGGQPGQPSGGDGPACLLANAVECIDEPGGGDPPAGGPGGHFPPVTFLTFNPTDGPVGGAPGSDLLVNAPAPEPATWLTMILGFGVLGQTLRVLRRKLA